MVSVEWVSYPSVTAEYIFISGCLKNKKATSHGVNQSLSFIAYNLVMTKITNLCSQKPFRLPEKNLLHCFSLSFLPVI